MTKRFTVQVVEYRAVSCSYLIEADSAEEARKLAAEGLAIEERVLLEEGDDLISRTAFEAEEVED
jgi:hypothetical protein